MPRHTLTLILVRDIFFRNMNATACKDFFSLVQVGIEDAVRGSVLGHVDPQTTLFCHDVVLVVHPPHSHLAFLLPIGRTGQNPFGGQTKFCPNGEHKLFVTRPRQGEKIIMNYCSAYFLVTV